MASFSAAANSDLGPEDPPGAESTGKGPVQPSSDDCALPSVGAEKGRSDDDSPPARLPNKVDENGGAKTPPASLVTPSQSAEIQRNEAAASAVNAPLLQLNFALRNATVGESYDEKIVPTAPDGSRIAGMPQLSNLDVSGFEACGLKCERCSSDVADGFHVTGSPEIAGEFRIEFTITWSRHLDQINQTSVQTLIVNPDPRSLWKNLPTDPQAECFKADTDSVHVGGIGHHIIAASRRGRSHAHVGTFRDDHIGAKVLPTTEWHLMVVADGAGSAPFSRRGAQIACDVCLEKLTALLSDSLLNLELQPLIQDWLECGGDQERLRLHTKLYELLAGASHLAFKTIRDEAAAAEREIKQYATTLLLVMARRFEFGWFVGAFGIGDGAIGVLRKDGSLDHMNTPDGGDFAGQTRFLTMPEIWQSGEGLMARIRFVIVREMVAIMSMSDGVSDPFFETDKNMGDATHWQRLWNELQTKANLTRENPHAATDLLEWLNFWSRGNHDDRSIAVLLPAPPKPSVS